MEQKNSKALLPVVIALGVLILAILALTVVVKIVGSVSVSKKNDDETGKVPTTEAYVEETTYVSDYALGDYSSKSGISSVTDESESNPDDALEDPDGYIIPDSASKKLTEEDLEGLTAQQLKYAVNEIYARHGRLFESKELTEYFNSKNWYEPNPDFDDKSLPKDELENAEFIKQYMKDNNLEYKLDKK